MTRASYVLTGTTLIGLFTSIYLWLDNRSLREDLADRADQTAAADKQAGSQRDPWLDSKPTEAARAPRSGTISATPAPALPSAPEENRNQRRARRSAEISALLGRGEDETEQEWKDRIWPL